MLWPLTRPAAADVIFVPNSSFEQDVQQSDPYGAGYGATGWDANNQAYTANPPGTLFIGAALNGIPVGGDGPQSAALGSFSSFRSAVPLANIVSGQTYTLTIAIGDSMDGGEPGTLRLGFLINDSFVPGGDITFAADTYSPEGTFTDFTLQYTALPADSGNTLKIFLGQVIHGGSVYLDNIRLTTSPVPEPATPLLVLSSLSIALLVRTRRGLRRITLNP